MNTNYAKLIDGSISFFSNPVKSEAMPLSDESISYIFTNDEEVIKELGYKSVIYTDRPEESGYYFFENWEETEDSIVQVWEKQEIPKRENKSHELIEIIDILTGEETSTTEVNNASVEEESSTNIDENTIEEGTNDE